LIILLIICCSDMPINKTWNDFSFYVINVYFEIINTRYYICLLFTFFIFGQNVLSPKIAGQNVRWPKPFPTPNRYITACPIWPATVGYSWSLTMCYSWLQLVSHYVLQLVIIIYYIWSDMVYNNCPYMLSYILVWCYYDRYLQLV